LIELQILKNKLFYSKHVGPCLSAYPTRTHLPTNPCTIKPYPNLIRVPPQ